jgi:hypothetical protein
VPTPPRDLLVPLAAVAVRDLTLIPDATRPVAAVVAAGGGAPTWITWGDASLPRLAVTGASVVPTRTGAWIVYESHVVGADSIEESTEYTAVHLEPEGVTAVHHLGTQRPVGDDTVGLWAGDPRDAGFWMGEDVADDDSDEDEPIDGSHDPASLESMPEGPFWPEAGTVVADDHGVGDDHHEFDDDDEVDLGDDADDDDDGTIVMTARQFAYRFVDADGREHDDDPLPEQVPADPLPTSPGDLIRVGPRGERHTIRVDRLVDRVRLDGDDLVIRFHPTGPREVASPEGWGWNVVYDPREARVATGAGLPSSIDTDALPSTAVPLEHDDDWEERERAETALHESWGDRFDLTGVAGAAWPLWDGDETARNEAVAALSRRLESLADPTLVWTSDHPAPRRGRSAYRDVVAERRGEWPATELVVSFEHTAVPFLRLSRRYRVFDDSGYPESWDYVDVHLEEDIATRHLPPRSAAVDGVLEI